MRLKLQIACILAAVLCSCSAAAKNFSGQKHEKHGKRTVWNLNGGVFFVTDGGLPGGACFRMAGRVTAPAFFNGLKRVDDWDNTYYERGSLTVSKFPHQLSVTFSLRDIPCDPDAKEPTNQPVLTPDMIKRLRLGLFWKDGVSMHPIKNYVRGEETILPLEPYATNLAQKLPKRYEWRFSFEVPSEGVPITDSLVFLLVTPEGKLAARVSARL